MIYMIKETWDGIELLQNESRCVIHNMKAMKFINEWCILNGSTYEGRREACSVRLQIHQKVPILVSEKSKDILFPTRKVTTVECIWLNYRGIDSFKRMGNRTLINFVNDEQIIIPVEYRSIKREISLCSQYLEIIEAFPI